MLQRIRKAKYRAFSFLLLTRVWATVYIHPHSHAVPLISLPHALFYSYGDLPSSQHSPSRLDELSGSHRSLFLIRWEAMLPTCTAKGRSGDGVCCWFWRGWFLCLSGFVLSFFFFLIWSTGKPIWRQKPPIMMFWNKWFLACWKTGGKQWCKNCPCSGAVSKNYRLMNQWIFFMHLDKKSSSLYIKTPGSEHS